VFTLDGSNLPGSPAGSPPSGASYSYAAVAPNAAGNPKQTGFMGTYGALNACSLNAYVSLIPATRRAGALAEGNYHLTAATELFTEIMFSRVRELSADPPPVLFGLPQFSFSQYTVPASNPYNPFGQDVGVADLLTGLGRSGTPFEQHFFRSLVEQEAASLTIGSGNSQDGTHRIGLSTPSRATLTLTPSRQRLIPPIPLPP